MDMIKVNEQLGEIVHLASAAILCDDEAIKRQAISDIEEAVAGLLVRTRTSTGHVTRTSTGRPGELGAHCPGKKMEKRYINSAGAPKAIEFKFDDRKLVAFLNDDHHETGLWGSDIYLDGHLVADVCVYDRGKGFCSKATVGCMKGIVMQLTHARRIRANRKAKLSGGEK